MARLDFTKKKKKNLLNKKIKISFLSRKVSFAFPIEIGGEKLGDVGKVRSRETWKRASNEYQLGGPSLFVLIQQRRIESTCLELVSELL